ncbi:hypothetical protein SAMN05443575_0335 [Jatrophihabitans endophyticus]|uniref:DUF6875 domain-containing protein n=1 Tax=Jatrophihabitans endophyticus TaxID=1206085 RepID=A0A1M5CS65_9ACTN|nr:hypothetical protein [Jatrophihabitans endophyticus]SHF57605.1 hypothetical protein SAMN05443575_0335 [Jatrophihabitans endophyticus]
MDLVGRSAAASSPDAELREVATWIDVVIARPHRDLGRSGPLCPYVPAALREDALHFGVLRGESVEAVEAEVVDLLEAHRSLSRPPSKYACIVLVARGISVPELLEVHRRVKPVAVDSGRMLGEFFPGYTSPGLHNPDFHPLTSPVPLLVIRHMVQGDDVFLAAEPAWVDAYRRTVVRV